MVPNRREKCKYQYCGCRWPGASCRIYTGSYSDKHCILQNITQNENSTMSSCKVFTKSTVSPGSLSERMLLIWEAGVTRIIYCSVLRWEAVITKVGAMWPGAGLTGGRYDSKCLVNSVIDIFPKLSVKIQNSCKSCLLSPNIIIQW